VAALVIMGGGRPGDDSRLEHQAKEITVIGMLVLLAAV
jgi:hypothetical protein